MTTSALADRIATAGAAQAVGKPASNNVLAWINSKETQADIARALPRGLDPARFARIVLTEIRKNPRLLEANPASFKLAVLNFAQLGLEPGPLGHAYLTGPFKNKRTAALEVVPILGYKGLKELAYRAGTVDLIDAVAVHEGEPFRIIRGSDQRLEHEELPECADAPIVAYYAIAFPRIFGGAGAAPTTGRAVFEVMWPADIAAIRKRSRASDEGPWVTDPEAMALKTVTRRLLNRGKVRLTSEVQEAIAEDEAREFGYDRQQFDIPAVLEGTAEEVPAALEESAAPPTDAPEPPEGRVDAEEAAASLLAADSAPMPEGRR